LAGTDEDNYIDNDRSRNFFCCSLYLIVSTLHTSDHI